jgi:hypothetical protein
VGRYCLSTAGKSYTTWISEGLTHLPKSVRSPGEKAEQKLIKCLVQEIRKGLGIDLDPTPSFDRGVDLVTRPAATNKQRSNARRQHEDLVMSGPDAELLFEGHLRIQKGTVAALAAKMMATIKAKRPEIVILYLLDNNVFCVLTEEGGKILCSRHDDGYHIEGDLVVTDKQAFTTKILQQCQPLLDVADGIKTVVVGPMPGYITASCC